MQKIHGMTLFMLSKYVSYQTGKYILLCPARPKEVPQIYKAILSNTQFSILTLPK